MRVYHYGTTTTNPIGRAYFGLFNCLSFLIETRGIGAGKTNFARRVYSQETAVKSYLSYAANPDNIEKIKTTVAEARQEVVDKGRTYDADDILAIYQTKSGETRSPYKDDRYQINLKTNELIKSAEDQTENLEDTIARGRVRPTAYVIPADLPEIEKILYILDNQGADYYKLDAGSHATLQQIYCVGKFDGLTGYNAENEKNIVADLRDPAEVTFANGAYVIPMDQVAGNVIAMLMEPDVTNSLGYDGTLFQYGVVSYDEQNNFPIYHYTGNDPRTTLVSNGSGTAVTFPDVDPEAWYAKAVEWAVQNKVMQGTDKGFEPSTGASRAMVATMLFRLEGDGSSAGVHAFTDVPSGQWYSDAVGWASANGIVKGTTETTFSPDDLITREQMATILCRYAEYKGYDVTAKADLSAFTDAGSIGDWATAAMQWANGVGLIEGTTATTLSPKGTADRAQIATLFMRFSQSVAK